jgi:hypothetical protein
MPDEKDKPNGGWSMPEPVFRSSEGRDVKTELDDPEADIPTEAADRDLNAETLPTMSQSIRPITSHGLSHANKRKRSFWEQNATSLLVLAILLIGGLIYLAWLYEGGSSN